MLHDSARLGVLMPPGIGFTSASCSAYKIMNGVISASVSAGSSQRVASVTWAPTVTVPAGWASTGAAQSHPSAARGQASAASCQASAADRTIGRSARVMGASWSSHRGRADRDYHGLGLLDSDELPYGGRT